MRWRVFLLLEAFAAIIVMAASGVASKTSGRATSTERYPPLPNRESHFPKQPELPLQQQSFLLGDNHLNTILWENNITPFSPIVSEANDTHEQNLIHIDVPGLPLGTTEEDFRDIPEDPVDDDAVVLDTTGRILLYFAILFFFCFALKLQKLL